MSNVRNFTVYSKTGCPYCGKIIQVLDHIKASYTVYSLGEHFDKDSFYGEFGNLVANLIPSSIISLELPTTSILMSLIPMS